MKKIIAVVLTLALLFSMSACSFDLFGLLKKGIDNLPADEAMAQVSENMKKVKGFKMEGTLDFTISAADISTGIQAEYETAQIKDPQQFHLNMKMDMSILGKGMREIEVYSFADGDGYTVYERVGDEWGKRYSEHYAADVYLDSTAYINDVLSYEMLGKDRMNGVDTLHYSGKVSKDKIEDIIHSSGMMMIFLNLFNTDLLEQEGLEDVILDVWVSEKENLPVRVTIDMTQFFKSFFESPNFKAGITVEKAEMAFDISDYNAVPEIVLPEEARNTQW